MQLPFDDRPSSGRGPDRHAAARPDPAATGGQRARLVLGAREPDSAGVPNGAGAPPYSHNNARADKLGGWPWRAAQRQRRLIPVSGFREPEKRAQEKGAAPWSYYNLKHGQPFLMVGLWSDAPDPATGEVADSYTLVIGEANAATRVQLSAAATV